MALLSPTPVAIALSAALLCSQAWAATVIEQKGSALAPKQANAAQPQTSKILLDATHARMDAGQPGQYMLMDFTHHKILMVNSTKKQAVDISAMPKMPAMPNAQQPAPKQVQAELTKVGAGPQIAGYATEQYQVKADGNVCSNEFISADAMKVAHITEFMQSMHKIAEDRRQAMANMPFFQQDPCAKAAEQMAGEVLKVGMLMRSEEATGQLRQEVISIQADVPTTAESFTVPAEYETLTPQQMMQRAMQSMIQQGQKGAQEGKEGMAAPLLSPEMQKKMQEEMAHRLEKALQPAK